jgi:hypothetical protein
MPNTAWCFCYPQEGGEDKVDWKIASAFFEQNRDMVKGKTQRVPVDHLIPRLHMATMDVGLTGV